MVDLLYIFLIKKEKQASITDRYIEVIERFGELRGEIQNFNVMSMGEVDDRVSHVFTTSHIPEMWSRARNLMHESILKPELLNRSHEFKSVYHGEEPRTCGCLEKMYHNITLPNGDVSLCAWTMVLNILLETYWNRIMKMSSPIITLALTCADFVKME